MHPKMIHDLNKKAVSYLSLFHCQRKKFFSGRKPYNLHVAFEGFAAYTDTPRIMLVLQTSRVLSTDWEVALYHSCETLNLQELDEVPL